jgi:hypothetical protein
MKRWPMSNQRVVVLTDEEIASCVSALAESNDCSIGAATAEAELKSILKYSKGHPGGITDEMVGNLIGELRGFDAGDEQDWIDARLALGAALRMPNEVVAE